MEIAHLHYAERSAIQVSEKLLVLANFGLAVRNVTYCPPSGGHWDAFPGLDPPAVHRVAGMLSELDFVSFLDSLKAIWEGQIVPVSLHKLWLGC
jgi:hypothetical protein